MKVLITGATGWLGKRFLEILTKGFENEGPPTDWKLRVFLLNGENTKFIEELSLYKKIEITFGDITETQSIKKAIKDIDVIFHLCGIIHPKRIKEFYKINTLGTLNILKEATYARVKRFIYISSNSVGGTNPASHILMNEDMPPSPYMHYGLSKYYAECLVKTFQHSEKIETVILRPCWFYGPYQPIRQTRFFKMISKGRPFVFGNGLNLRSMCYLDNLSQAMILSATSPYVVGKTYWIADARPYTILEIYYTIAELLEVKNFKPIFIPNFVSNIASTVDRLIQTVGFYQKEIHVIGEMNKNIACSIERAKREFGYNPHIDLKEGMRRSIEWCKKMKLL